ncbi:hypothetical protein HNQ50_004053 [Silvimonas terrae]|uniref:Integral membrane bound transporter domain-containing protein n=1 Tax=Silvimonas terrae TaxID=300266 RepID=A0A840RI13_9NEIS|nr:FUSC family protein [Silvimonas terrae]MBB5193299.1 hypothetical protein [Silvimonas terrae]
MALHPSLILANTPINRRKMFRGAIAVGLPLLIALTRGEFLPAVYGGVAGFYTLFVDYGGETSERIAAIIYMTLGMLLAGIAGVAGHYVPGAGLALLVGFALFAGWLQGAGGSVEFIGKYWLVAFLFGDSAPDLPPLCGTYLIIGGLSGILSVLVSLKLFEEPEYQTAPMLREAARHLMRRRHNNGAFALYFASLVLAGYLLGQWLGLLRYYWVPLTIAIVTVYDAHHSMHRLIQRLVGSLIGVVAGAAVIYYVQSEWVLAILVTLMAAMTPAAQARNYWVAVIPITALVMVLLDFGLQRVIASPMHFALARVENTVLACALCAVGSGLYLKMLPRIEAWQAKQHKPGVY